MKSLDEICRPLINGIRTHRAVRMSYNKDIAFDFNPINLFKVNESCISSIIAFFLNPQESHGQGDAFLKAFFNKWRFFAEEEKQELDLSKAEVICEACTHNRRRIDIFIKLDGKCIIIENKLWALDQIKQLHDYISYAESEKLEWRCVYLTLNGDMPSKDSLDEKSTEGYLESKQLRLISHATDMPELFDEFASVCKAESVRAFIKALIKYYEYSFKNNVSMQEQDIIKEELRKNMELFEIADQIALAKRVLKQEIKNGIVESCLKTFLGDSLGEKYYFQWKGQKWAKQCISVRLDQKYLLFSLPGNNEASFSIVLEYGSGDRLYCGIHSEKNESKKKLEEHYGKDWENIKASMLRKHPVWIKYEGAWAMVIDLINMDHDDYYLPFLKGEKTPKEDGEELGRQMSSIFNDLRKEWDAVFFHSN